MGSHALFNAQMPRCSFTPNAGPRITISQKQVQDSQTWKAQTSSSADSFMAPLLSPFEEANQGAMRQLGNDVIMLAGVETPYLKTAFASFIHCLFIMEYM